MPGHLASKEGRILRKSVTIFGLVAIGCGNSLLAQVRTADASRGEQLLHNRGCVNCHTIGRRSGNAAPDLEKLVSRGYTPSSLAGVVWNHARFRRAEIGTSPFSEEQAADLFAYFASRRFFEPLGDAGRGKRIFATRHCADCHGIRTRLSAEANPVVAWRSLRDPVAFAQEMWNRPPAMAQAFARKNLRFTRFTSQELNDLLVYLENLPGVRDTKPRFRLAPTETGRTLFRTKGCAGCHHGRLSLEDRASRLTMADVSTAMWNHPLTNLGSRPLLSYDEMSGIISYLWSAEASDNPRRGKHIFVKKKCASCHSDSETDADRFKIPLARRYEGVPVSMMTALWNHRPATQAEMREKGLTWPLLARSEMADLAAYLRGPRP